MRCSSHKLYPLSQPFKGLFKFRLCLSSEGRAFHCMVLSPGHLTFHTEVGNWSELSFFHTWVGLQRQPKVVEVVWSSEVTPEIHGPSSECLDLIDKTTKSPISGLVEVFPLIKTVSNSIVVKADTWNLSCYIKIWPWATEMDKRSFHQLLFPIIIPRSSSHWECFHGFSVLNRLCVVPSPVLLMIDTDVGVIQVGFGNWEWLSETIFFFLVQYMVWSREPLGADTAWRKQKHHSQEQDKNDGKTTCGAYFTVTFKRLCKTE